MVGAVRKRFVKRFSISSRGRSSIEVQAVNWVSALGMGLQGYEVVDALERLACEVLPNGTVIARDIATGSGFIVREIEGEISEDVPAALVERPSEPVHAMDEDSSTPRVSSRLGRIHDAETRGKACQAALVLARKVVAAESGAVILSDRSELRFFAAAGPKAHKLIGARITPDEGVAGFVIRQGRPIVLDDATQDDRHSGDIDQITGYVTHALACVPVMHDNHVFGVIEMINLPDNTTFSRRCVAELSAIAMALGERLERHRLKRS